MSTLLYPDESYKIIGAFFEVHKCLGAGFLESVYQEALAKEFESRNIRFKEQWGIDVFYKGIKLEKHFFADFICFNDIIIEIKAIDNLAPIHEAQLINYLKATKKQLGFLVNFGESSLVFKRLINTID
jgi:GxxExxY protein